MVGSSIRGYQEGKASATSTHMKDKIFQVGYVVAA